MLFDLRMAGIYNRTSPIFLLVSSWVLMFIAVGFRYVRTGELLVLNLLFIPIGLGAYYLPGRSGELNKGEALRRKLIWLLFGAGVVIVVYEIVRSITG